MTNLSASRPPRGAFWAWLPVALLGSMLAGLGTLAFLAMDDPSFALEPNYYDKAVHWERSQAQSRENVALGLHLDLTSPLMPAPDGSVRFELALKGRDHAPLLGASIVLEAFPNAYASRVQRMTLREEKPGLYRGELKRANLGLWELRASVTHGASFSTYVLRHDVTKPDAV